jgi:RNA polymerase sigma-70 factor (ECF subfamily)
MWRALTAFSGSREIAQDAVSEAFAQALRRGDGIRSLQRWVWKSAYRIAAGELQRRSTLVALTVDPSVSYEEPAWELRSALTQLPERQRAVVVLHYYGGYSARDIARIVGSTSAGVWVSLSRGRQRLRGVLEVTDD